MDFDLEDWIVDKGGEIAEKEAKEGADSLTDWEKIVSLLWSTDYMMRNAGDFANAEELCPNFQTETVDLATSLGLAKTLEAFLLEQQQLEQEYFDRFPSICKEIQDAEQ